MMGERFVEIVERTGWNISKADQMRKTLGPAHETVAGIFILDIIRICN